MKKFLQKWLEIPVVAPKPRKFLRLKQDFRGIAAGEHREVGAEGPGWIFEEEDGVLHPDIFELIVISPTSEGVTE